MAADSSARHDLLTDIWMAPQNTARLARGFYQHLARRVVSGLPNGDAEALIPSDAKGVMWLHPRSVWAATTLGVAGVREEYVAEVRSDLGRATTPPPPLEHLGARDGGLWSTEVLQSFQSDMAAPAPTVALRPVVGAMTEPVAAATAVLRRVWVEAAVEVHLLIRAIVHVEGGNLVSASEQRSFGAIYVGEGSLRSIPAAYEMLLHETAHHSMFLRNSYAGFVTNGSEMASHPLRADPRPVAATVHAAHALAAMAEGLSRWSAEPGAPSECYERRDQALDRLSRTTAVLKEKARWTAAGEQYFASLLQRERRLLLQPSSRGRSPHGGSR
ncbi:aKG-HExxH-type peptide beta-hydroxylase [Streptomyces sp. NPDC001537]